jgi:ribose 5-phosphate isomerase B
MNDSNSPIIIGCDHAAYPLKEKVKNYLTGRGIEVNDVGTDREKSVNYPDFGKKVALMISKAKFKRGILLCGTGIGMSMVANKYPHVRAALCTEPFSAEMSRRHNDSNILVMGGRITGETLALEIVRVWLETPFDGGRHQERLNQFDTIDSG